MTIAAGFCATDGILICADTLYSGDWLNAYGSKIVSFDCECGKLVFAFSAQCVEYAQAAIYKCHQAVATVDAGLALTHADIAEVIGTALDFEYRKQVFQNPDSVNRAYFLLIGIWSKTDGLGLYATCETTIRRSSTGFEATGCSQGFAQYLAADMYPQMKPLSGVLAIAAYIMSQVKANVAGCGGKTHTAILRKDGSIESYPWFETELKENAATEYARQSNLLLCNLLSKSDVEFDESVKHFIEQTKRLRRSIGIDSESVEQIQVEVQKSRMGV